MFAEPSYTLAGKYKLGLRLEQGFFPMKQIASKAFSFDYFLYNHRQLGLFAGTGISNFNVTEAGGCGGNAPGMITVRNTKHTGAFFRTGLEFQHFRVAAEYNLVPSSYVTNIATNGESLGTVIYKNNYLALKAGVLIGGGKKKRISHSY